MNRQIPQVNLKSKNDLMPVERNSISYLDFLKNHNISNINDYGIYYLIGQTDVLQGWIIHLSLLDINFFHLMDKLVPFLLEQKIAFSIPQTNEIHRMIQDGSFGYENLGKSICIFPNRNLLLEDLIINLFSLTEGISGPAIPTDFHLGSIIYVKYGSYRTPDPEGNKYITDWEGNSIPDYETSPFVLQTWIKWPFDNIKPYTPIKEKSLLNGSYLLRKIVKNDFKGRVIIGLYQKNMFLVKKCIIKEGKASMCIDEEGRSIEDRIFWQQAVLNDLITLDFVPKVVDFFMDNNRNTYLVTSFIKGKNFSSINNHKTNAQSWESTSIKQKKSTIDILINLILNIQILHEKGYVHRDLNIDNFLLDKKGKVWIIDFELCYNINKQTPIPPFETGTIGYMSPEQKALSRPDFKQDIFSIGALTTTILSRISITKFNVENKNQLKKALNFFLKEEKISELILNCLSENPSQRPEISEILNELLSIKNNRLEIIPTYAKSEIDTQIIPITNKAIIGLGNPSMMNSQGYWSSPLYYDNLYSLNPRNDRNVYFGFEKGISGVLYLIALAKKNGFNISSINHIIAKNWEMLEATIQDSSFKLGSGLLRGKAGIAIGITELVNSNILPNNNITRNYIRNCLEIIPQNLNIFDGLAGYGLALIKCSSFLESDFLQQRLTYCCEKILERQNRNGSWSFKIDDNQEHELTGFLDGISGILWFLLNAEQTFSRNLFPNIQKGINYLSNKMKKSINGFYWNISNKINIPHTLNSGNFLILLPFIKGFEINRDIKNKKTIEDILSFYPDEIISDNLSQINGISGLGEVYLEAWKVFDDPKWRKKADWIKELIINIQFEQENQTYWIQDDPTTPYADLLTGNSGIVHFLLRCINPKEISHLFSC